MTEYFTRKKKDHTHSTYVIVIFVLRHFLAKSKKNDSSIFFQKVLKSIDSKHRPQQHIRRRERLYDRDRPRCDFLDIESTIGVSDDASRKVVSFLPRKNTTTTSVAFCRRRRRSAREATIFVHLSNGIFVVAVAFFVCVLENAFWTHEVFSLSLSPSFSL